VRPVELKQRCHPTSFEGLQLQLRGSARLAKPSDVTLYKLEVTRSSELVLHVVNQSRNCVGRGHRVSTERMNQR
jgi:hypothetical protein